MVLFGVGVVKRLLLFLLFSSFVFLQHLVSDSQQNPEFDSYLCPSRSKS